MECECGLSLNDNSLFCFHKAHSSVTHWSWTYKAGVHAYGQVYSMVYMNCTYGLK